MSPRKRAPVAGLQHAEDAPADDVEQPRQEGDRPAEGEPQEPQDRPPVKRTRTLDVFVTRRHNLDKATWLEFCAAVTALAEQIPPGVNPSVSVRRITVSWEERE